jgi:hypothetical protein
LQQIKNAIWSNWNHRRDFFDSLGTHLNFFNLDDYYKLSEQPIQQYGGSGLLEYCFHGSIWKALEDVYPDHQWLPWRLSQKLPSQFWINLENQRHYMNWLGNRLGFKKMTDWVKLTRKLLIEHSGRTLLSLYGRSIIKLLKSVFPEVNWNSSQ